MTRVKWNIKLCKEYVEKQGYKLLSTEYTRAKDKMLFECPKGHKFESKWSHFYNDGSRCSHPDCLREKARMDRQHSFEKVKSDIESEGYILIDSTYVNSKTKLKMNCPKGHECEISYDNFVRGKVRCKICSRALASEKQKTPFSVIQQKFSEEGYILLSKEEEYVNSRTKLSFRCPNGHYHKINWHDFSSKNVRCKECNISKGEKRIEEYLNTNQIQYVHDKNIWKNNELRPDFFLPDYNLVIEYDGIQHFEPTDFAGRGEEWAENNFIKIKFKDEEKNNYCKNNDINLIRIPYWEFDNIENILKQTLIL